jgi:hypothetical protein
MWMWMTSFVIWRRVCREGRLYSDILFVCVCGLLGVGLVFWSSLRKMCMLFILLYMTILLLKAPNRSMYERMM